MLGSLTSTAETECKYTSTDAAPPLTVNWMTGVGLIAV